MKNILILSIALIAVACSQEKKAPQQEVDTAKATTELATPIDSYLLVKDALVSSDIEMTADAARQFIESAEANGMNDKSIRVAEAIANSKDLETQRTEFETLTALMMDYAKSNDLGKALFVQYCPMAFDNKGASWISDVKEIRNPYFGDMMLKCGRVTEEL